MKSMIMAGIVAVALLIVVMACTTEKTVYVLPDGTEVTPTAAQATQAAGVGSQADATIKQPTSEDESMAMSTSFPEDLELYAESYAQLRVEGVSHELAQSVSEEVMGMQRLVDSMNNDRDWQLEYYSDDYQEAYAEARRNGESDEYSHAYARWRDSPYAEFYARYYAVNREFGKSHEYAMAHAHARVRLLLEGASDERLRLQSDMYAQAYAEQRENGKSQRYAISYAYAREQDLSDEKARTYAEQREQGQSHGYAVAYAHARKIGLSHSESEDYAEIYPKAYTDAIEQGVSQQLAAHYAHARVFGMSHEYAMAYAEAIATGKSHSEAEAYTEQQTRDE